MTTTLFVAVFMAAIPLGWEIYTLTQDELLTISEVFRHLGREWNPFVMYIVNVLVGHFWITPSVTLAQYLGEWAEVAVVLLIGWSIFWVFRANSHLLPLNSWESTVLIALSIAVGAFAWTIGA